MTQQRQSPLATDEQLLAVLERARAVGFLGPGPLRVHLDHARSYGAQIPASARSLVDLGSGGGLPGLPLLADHTHLRGVLLDAASKRTAFLVWAAVELGLADRVDVVTARAEQAAHDRLHRCRYDVVVCRGFGPPALTLECSAGFVADDGRLLISEPPDRRRWNNAVLAEIGLGHETTSEGVAVFRRIAPPPDATPRSYKRMQKQPLEVERA
jgi:16S rRNA (guanine527-N7)-methyltransferase